MSHDKLLQRAHAFQRALDPLAEALVRDLASALRVELEARQVAYMNGYEACKDELRPVIHEAEDRAERLEARLNKTSGGLLLENAELRAVKAERERDEQRERAELAEATLQSARDAWAPLPPPTVGRHEAEAPEEFAPWPGPRCPCCGSVGAGAHYRGMMRAYACNSCGHEVASR